MDSLFHPTIVHAEELYIFPCGTMRVIGARIAFLPGSFIDQNVLTDAPDCVDIDLLMNDLQIEEYEPMEID